jgi:hypothetical protein
MLAVGIAHLVAGLTACESEQTREARDKTLLSEAFRSDRDTMLSFAKTDPLVKSGQRSEAARELRERTLPLARAAKVRAADVPVTSNWGQGVRRDLVALADARERDVNDYCAVLDPQNAGQDAGNSTSDDALLRVLEAQVRTERRAEALAAALR